MRLTVLNVAYPFAPVAPDTAGGAEQVLAALDAALCRAGHRSLVIACRGSRASGRLIAVPRLSGPLDEAALARGRARHARAVAAVLARRRVDLVHLHGVDFHHYLPPAGVPALATLHLPVAWYPPAALGHTWLNCVSASQHATAGPLPNLLAPIENGVDLDAFRPGGRRGRFALMLARICPEKGVHLAIEAARSAGVPLILAGAVFPHEAHRLYFEDEVRPRLDRLRRWIGPVGPRRKRRLLASARCVLVPSLVDETSSLVAREAAASGAPVIAFPRGALRDVVDHGRTGFLVETVAGMADAIRRADEIAPAACRALAAARFSAKDMLGRYLALYASLAQGAA